MALPAVALDQDHVAAHNNERTEINKLTVQLNGLTVWTGTQAEYDAIGTKSTTTLYFIKQA